ncbi:MAG: hypothetical protein LBG45_07630 [Dysgonamonadaceae bacterium]|jgi:hypothetical protein|nr:hypothetical protein [Dysgonamonadaceae bacterium]
MNRIFCTLLILLFSACVHEQEKIVSSETVFEVENYSAKDIIYAVKTEIGNDTLYLKPQDIKKMSFRKEKKQVVETYPAGETLFDLVEFVKSYEQMICSLTDTARYIRISGLGASEQDTIFDASRHESLEGDVFNRVVRVVIEVTDSLLTIAEKDYIMLKEFKEYYANE